MATEKKPHRNKRFHKLLVERFNGVQVAMANALGISPSLVHRYAFGDKGIGEDMKNTIEEKLKLVTGWLDLNDTEQPMMIDLSKISLEKLEFMREIESMSDDEFRAKAGVFKALAAVPTKKESNHNGD
jgi:predicted transcriptional regulator